MLSTDIKGNTKKLTGPSVPQVVLDIPQRAMFLRESNFKRARDFIPERWLGTAEYENDRRDCFNPFRLGPRKCVGMK